NGVAIKQHEPKSGTGGETHQQANTTSGRLTTNQGVTIADNQNQLKAHGRGPALLEDMIFREKMMHFDHERIPERIVHARGTGAHGYFELTESLADYTTARVLAEVGSAPRSSPASRRCKAATARSTRRATCAVSP